MKEAKDYDLQVAQRIKSLRIFKAGLSATELGRRIGTTAGQIHKYEAGANRISVGRLKDIANALGVRIFVLLPEEP